MFLRHTVLHNFEEDYKMTIQQKQEALLTALVEDLCEESSAEEVFERLITVGENFGITEDDIVDMGFAPMNDEE